MRRTVLIALVGLLVAGACSSGRTRQRVTAPPPSSTTTTTSAAPETTTTTEAPTTTTAAPAPPTSQPVPAVVTSATGVVLPVLGLHPTGGLDVTTPCSGRAVITHFTPVPATAVVLDPGHGGREKGAIGPDGLAEKAVNLAVAVAARDALDKAGVPTILDRTGDYDVTLQDRADIALALKPQAFVSIHHNAEPDGPRDGPGTETYYQVASADSKRLAGLIYEEVVRALAQYQGVAWVADTDAGAKYRRGSTGDDYYAVLRRTHGVVAALAELGYITNPPEAALYGRPDVQRVEGEAVARGIVRYLRTKDPGSGFVEPYPRTTPAGGGGGPEGCVDPAL